MSFVQHISKLLSASGRRKARPEAIAELPFTTGAEGALHIETPDPTAEDSARDKWQKLGQRLARQDDWEQLCFEIRRADDTRALTPGGMSMVDLLAFGARADVIGAVEHAFMDGQPAQNAPILDGIEALETVLAEHEDDYPIALVVAQAHMDIAWIWLGHDLDADVSAVRREAFAAHMDRAGDILEKFCGKSLGAPSLLAACCGLHAAQANPLDHLVKSFSALIELNPKETRQMRNFGVRLLPRRDGDYSRLELEARRTASALHHIWGSGGYSWVMFDAISADEEALAGLDISHFTQGLRDILALRADQYTVNLLAAYCAITMGPSPTERSAGTMHPRNEAAEFNRAHIHRCRDWIICEYMTELHPLIWAHAVHGFDNNLRIRSAERFAAQGQSEAKRILSALFLPELARGQDVTFTENGPNASLPT